MKHDLGYVLVVSRDYQCHAYNNDIMLYVFYRVAYISTYGRGCTSKRIYKTFVYVCMLCLSIQCYVDIHLLEYC